MEATPKVHRHRHRRTESRHRRNAATEQPPTTESPSSVVVQAANETTTATPTTTTIPTETATATITTATTTAVSLDSSDCHEVFSQSSQQTVVLINGHAPTTLDDMDDGDLKSSKDAVINVDELTHVAAASTATHLESPTQQNPGISGGGGGGGGSSRNSSGDALSLRETLQQLPSSITAPHHHHHHHHHRIRRTHSPQSPQTKRSAAQEIVDSSFHRGILGFMDRELKQSSPTPSALSVGGGAVGGGGSSSSSRKPQQSLSDPQASPAQRSLRSRSSIEKSPRRKRSKSESRRRRERKLIAAGEMEVRQANETLMRYLKQCSEMNDASLSGELEIDQSYDERRVHRKTKSQRDKRGHLISKLYTAGGLSSILKELSDDIVPADGEEIYNPFTPVVSPTEDTPAHIDKMFLQTSSGYRPVEHCYYKHSFVGNSSSSGGGGVGNSSHHHHHNGMASDRPLTDGGRGMRSSRSYGDTRYLLDAECGRSIGISSTSELACVVQRFWLLIANICHGLLAGLALAHLIFALTTTSAEWTMFLNHLQLSDAADAPQAVNVAPTATTPPEVPIEPDPYGANAEDMLASVTTLSTTLADYSLFVQIYLNIFYCLTIVCLVSVLDRMDICRWDLSNASELISFRWLIIAMIYIATIVLTICSDALEKRLYYYSDSNANVTNGQDELHTNMILGVWSSLSITRSIGAICGWIMIGLTPQEDLLYEHLIELTKYRLAND